MKLQPYLRISEGLEKGQDPERQAMVIRAWAPRQEDKAQGLAVELLAPVEDVDKSASKTNPFERPQFREAVKRAVSSGAAGIVVSEADRFCRQGWEEEGWAIVELRKRHGLRVFTAEASMESQSQFGGRIHRALKSELNREIMVDHARKVRSGMDLAKVKGTKSGKPAHRPPKVITPEEVLTIKKLAKPPHNQGYGSIAVEINKRRGALELADRADARRRGISPWLVRKVLVEVGLRKAKPVGKAAKAGGLAA